MYKPNFGKTLEPTISLSNYLIDIEAGLRLSRIPMSTKFFFSDVGRQAHMK